MRESKRGEMMGMSVREGEYERKRERVREEI